MQTILYITMGRLLAICAGLIISVIINALVLLRYLAQKFPGLFFEEEEPEQEKRPQSKYFINL